MITFNFDFSEWVKYNVIIQQMLQQVPVIKRQWLRRITARYRAEISSALLSQNIKYTGTYEQSIKIIETGTDLQPGIALVLDPTGREAARLPIYWTILEFGGRPNPNVPSSRIVSWSEVKFGNPALGFRIANSIRSRGIRPHPILSNIFILAPPSGDAIGLTFKAERIAEEEAQFIMNNWERQYIQASAGAIPGRQVASFTRRGRVQIQFRAPAGAPGGTGGQFIR